MGTLVFQANLGGAVNLVGPNTASTVNFTLPSADGSSGQALVTNGSGTLSFSSFVSAAAGSNTQVQFNSSGAFAGSANLTFNGTTLTAANTSVTTSETLSYGTANGVAYLNGSKVVTTGSALTFDGTNLGVGGVSNTYSGYTVLTLNNAVNGPIFDLNYAGTRQATFLALTNEVRIGSIANSPFTFYQNGSEQMRLTSTGLGIGTSSPSEKLTVAGAGLFTGALANYRTSSAAIDWFNGITRIWGFGANSSTAGTVQLLTSSNNGSVINTLTYDSSGNLGLGVTPSANDYTGAAQFKWIGHSVTPRAVDNLAVTMNAYHSGGGWKYGNTGVASAYIQGGGAHTWLTAPSGTAGNAITFTQAMTLDASGNLLVGYTSVYSAVSNYKTLQVNGATGGILDLGNSTSVTGRVSADVNGLNLEALGSTYTAFRTNGSERARIDSSGNLLVGTTSSSYDTITNGLAIVGTGAITAMGIGHVTGSGSGTKYASFNYNGSSIGSITQNGTTGVLYNLTSDYRLKNNPTALTGAKEFVMALQPKTWDWWDGSGKGVGFIAHEFMEVAKYSGNGEKDAVDENGNPVYQSIQPSSSEVMANLVALIQEQQNTIEQLKARLDAANL